MTIHHIEELLHFIDASPSPWHAVQTIERRLQASGFSALPEQDSWQLQAGGRYYVIRDASSIILFVVGQRPLLQGGFRIVGAHTDSPGLRIKPNAALQGDGLLRLGVEVYGGPILATFADRDLSLAGRLCYRDGEEIASRLVHVNRPLLRLPNLAIHMNRKVNEDGLKFDKQKELPLLFATAAEQQLPRQQFLAILEQYSGIEAQSFLSWELNVYDTQKGELWGGDRQFIADSQLDNLASCHAGLTALLDPGSLNADNTLVCAFFDHEEIGSTSRIGADGSFLSDTLERIALALHVERGDLHRAMARSFLVSADMAHAYQPNFPGAYEPDHRVGVNQGPVIKINANQRYSSESVSAAMFISWCEQAGIPYQKYSHRSDIPCGSTIGPISAARLGIRSVDVGNPMWAMHSVRESAGVLDHDYMIRALKKFFAGR